MGIEPRWRGIYDDKGRLMVAICHNMDLGDSWEHADNPLLSGTVFGAWISDRRELRRLCDDALKGGFETFVQSITFGNSQVKLRHSYKVIRPLRSS